MVRPAQTGRKCLHPSGIFSLVRIYLLQKVIGDDTDTMVGYDTPMQDSGDIDVVVVK